jgi:hypothetical protein
MSQGMREMLSNRRFAIPLIVLLAFCFIGLILVGVVLILRPGAPDGGTPVAQATSTTEPEATGLPTSTPTESPTPRATPTLVPVGTPVTPVSDGTPVTPVSEEPTPTTAAPTPQPTSAAEEDELADTGIGWGLILFSGAGLAVLVIMARRVRLAQ